MASARSAPAHHTTGKAASQMIHSDLPPLLTGKIHPSLSLACLPLGSCPLPCLTVMTSHSPSLQKSAQYHPQMTLCLLSRMAYRFLPPYAPRQTLCAFWISLFDNLCLPAKPFPFIHGHSPFRSKRQASHLSVTVSDRSCTLHS